MRNQRQQYIFKEAWCGQSSIIYIQGEASCLQKTAEEGGWGLKLSAQATVVHLQTRPSIWGAGSAKATVTGPSTGTV